MNSLFKPLCFGLALQAILCPGAEAFPGGASLHWQKSRKEVKAPERTLQNALEALQNRFKVSIAYRTELVENKTTAYDVAQSPSLREALEALLSPHGLKYREIEEGTFVISPGEITAESGVRIENIPLVDSRVKVGLRGTDLLVKLADKQRMNQLPVKGKVTVESTGEALIGAHVQVQGTSLGTITDVNGNYSLQVPDANSVLVFSFIGMVTQNMPVGNRSVIDVVLVPTVQSLSEVVVVGYGTQERKDLTGAVSVVSAKDLEKMSVAGFDQALQGRAAGVQVSSNSGAPGAGVTVRVRGTGTIGNNNPLYVIDGVPTGPESLNLFNPNDIESITVLKDAATATIYGSRAANGVILVTTKKGKKGEPRLQFDSYYGWQQAWRIPQLLNVTQYATILNEAYVNAGRPAPYGRPDTLGAGNNWLDELFGVAPIQQYNLLVSGGSNQSKYLVSGSYFNQRGILPNSDFKRWSFRVNTSHQLKNRWTVGNNLALSHSSGNQINTNSLGGVLANAVFKRPFDRVYDDNGWLAESATDPNPIAAAHRTDNQVERLRLFGNVFLEYELAKGLKIRSNVGLDVTYAKNKNYTVAFGATPNTLNEYRDQSYTPLWQNSLSLERRLGDAHQIGAVFSVDAQSNRYEFASVKVDKFTTDEEYNRYINAGQSVDISSIKGNAGEWALLSFIGRVNYGYRDKYLLSASYRRDGSSRFLKERRWGDFPAFSTAWRISEEAFLKDNHLISDLKIRGSWGQMGNQEVGKNYAPYNTVTNANIKYTFGPGAQNLYDGLGIPTNGRGGARLASPDLTWETSTQTDVGVDLGLWNNKLLLTADYFDRRTRNMLLDQPVSTVSGATMISINAGSVRNRGLELSLTYQQTERSFTYGINGNFTLIKNQLVSLNPEVAYILGPVTGTQGVVLTKTTLGDPIGSYYGYITDGVFQNQAQIEEHAYQSNGTAPGDIRFRNLNGDTLINNLDQTNIGSPIPDFLYGANFNFGYKGFDLSIFLQGVHGNKIYNQLAMRSQDATNLFNKFEEIMGRWTGEGTSNREPRLHLSDPNNNRRVSDRFVEDGSYLRLKNVQLGYSLPDPLAKRWGLAKARIYVSGQNLLTFTNYSGFDPEMSPSTEYVDGRGADLEVGADKGRYPQARIFTIGLNLGF